MGAISSEMFHIDWSSIAAVLGSAVLYFVRRIFLRMEKMDEKLDRKLDVETFEQTCAERREGNSSQTCIFHDGCSATVEQLKRDILKHKHIEGDGVVLEG